ncbi:MAG: hypothetical protein JNL60_02605 [Bacteroidia bacterium]|nr:hypothetical protein [Bacteroidia bacterium]
MIFFRNTLTLLSLLCLLACNKAPEADFSIDANFHHPGHGPIYFMGQPIVIQDNSVDGKKYTWEFPDGTVSHDKNPSYLIPINPRISKEETITLIVSRGKAKASKVSRTFRPFIPAQEGDYFSIGNFKNNKPLLKGIYAIEDGQFSFRFTEENYPAKLEGRVLFKDQIPTPGEYSISEGSVKVQVSTTGYYGNMPCKSKPEWGGKVSVSRIDGRRLKIKFTEIRVYDEIGKTETLASGDLIY